MKAIYNFFKSFHWYNWGSIIPWSITFKWVAVPLGANPEATWFTIVGMTLTLVQVSCLGVLVYNCVHTFRESRRQDREVAEMSNKTREEVERMMRELREARALAELIVENHDDRRKKHGSTFDA